MNDSEARLVILIPCFNEAGRVGAVVDSIRNSLPSALVVVIDDCSSDDSAREATAKGATVLSHTCNLGYGAALQTGYRFALSKGAEIVVQLDADGQHDPKSIPAIAAPVKEGHADLCLGSRHLSSGSAATPIIRRLGQRVFAITIRLFGGPLLSDPTSGFQALNRRTLALFADDVFPCDYPDSDVILMAHYTGLRITEVPTCMSEREGGLSLHSGLKPLYYGVKMIFSMILVLLNLNKWRALAAKLPAASRNGG